MSRNPGPPSAGYQPIKLVTNSFEITTLPTKTYYQYDIFDPPEKKPKKIQLFHHLQNAVAPEIFENRLVYDGQAIAYSPRKLLLANNGNGTFTVRLGTDTVVPPGTKGSFQIRLTLTAGGNIESGHVNDVIINRTNSSRAQVATNLMQLVMRQGPNQFFTNNGRAYFTGREKKAIDGSGIELWRGIFQSVRPTIGKMILTMDTCTAAVYKGGSLLNLCMEHLELRNIHDLELRQTSPNFRKLESFIKKLRIKVLTGHGKSRVKTIRGLQERAGEFSFLKDDTHETNVARYFNEAHGIMIKHTRIVGVRLTGKNAPRPDIVPLEICNVEPGQLFKKKIPERYTTDMVKFATMRPQDRLRKITDGIRDYRNSEFVTESGMVVRTDPMTIDAKLLNVPAVFFGDARPLPLKNGAWNVLRQNFKTPQPFSHWVVVNFTERFDERKVQQMMSGLASSCQTLGMKTSPPHVYSQGNGQNVHGSLDSTMVKLQNIIPLSNEVLRKLIFIILVPQSAAPIRSAIKYWGDIVNGFTTLCLREGKLNSANDQYWNNIALKINARLGGINFISRSPVMNEISSAPFMIMGADVGHPGPGIQKPSVTSIVYSHDPYATQYVALTGIQPPRIEQIHDLRSYVMNALNSFGAKNGFPPKRLFFFRDGLSEGEYDVVAKNEISEIKGAMTDLWAKMGVKDPLPTLTFIVVGKRHHAVFFPVSQQAGDRTGNCFPGSLIDSGITHPAVRDFYLQSHAAIQGTCRSSHYIVLEDQNFGFQLAKIQELAYTLCHIYAKATRSVSIPAPVYYADLVCSRGLFHVDPNANLQFDDSSSTHSGATSLDMNPWQEAFKTVHERLQKTMYFL